MEVGLGPGDFVFDGAQLPKKKCTPTPTLFLAHVYCGQTAGWIKMPLGTEVNLGPGDVELDGVAASPLKRAQPPVFGSCLLCPNGWMDEDTTWYASRSRPRSHCIRRGPSSPLKGHTAPPHLFGPVYCGHGRPSQLLQSSC